MSYKMKLSHKIQGSERQDCKRNEQAV